MTDWVESAEAIGAVDAVLAGVGLEHGRRKTLAGSWKDGARVKRLRGTAPQPAKAVQKTAEAGVVRIPAFDALPWLRAGFSTRVGGHSTMYSDGTRGELNLGWTESDEPRHVAGNRQRFLQAVVGESEPAPGLATVRQFHSGMVRVIEADHGALQTNGKAVLRGDGLITDVAGILLGIQTADCVPVLVADRRTRAVAAFHAGWRGTLRRIVERGLGTMKLRYGSRAEDLVAAIGPGIGPCCYAVGEELRFDFESQFAYAPELFHEVYDSDPVREKYPLLFLTARAPGHSNIGPQIHVDLLEANRRQLLDAGVSAESITVCGECTGCCRDESGARKYFSHRMDHGFAGRMMSVIGVVPESDTRS